MLLLIRSSLLCVLLAIALAVPAPESAPAAPPSWLSKHLKIHSSAQTTLTQLGYLAKKPNPKFRGTEHLRTTSSSSVLKRQPGNVLNNAQTAPRKKTLFNRRVPKNLKLNLFPRSSKLTRGDGPPFGTFSLNILHAKRGTSNSPSLHQSNRGKGNFVEEPGQSKTVVSQYSPIWTSVLDVSRATSERAGLTGESCTTTSDCLAERVCVDLEAEDICSGGSSCVCVQIPVETCESSSDCETDGEVCVDGPSGSLCFSESVAQGTGEETVGEPTEDPSGESGGGGNGTGLTGDSCTSTSDCLPERECFEREAQALCSSGSSCICLNPTPETCETSSDCETAGEVCIVLPDGLVCASESFATEIDAFVMDEDLYEDGDGDGTGLTGDSCTFNSDCLRVRLCFDGETEEFCRGGSSCRCFPPIPETCTSSSDCGTDGEVCIVVEDGSVCGSKSAAQEMGLEIVGEEQTQGGGVDGDSSGSGDEGEDENDDGDGDVDGDSSGSGDEGEDENGDEHGDGDEEGDSNGDEGGNGEPNQNEDGLNTNGDNDEEVCIDARALQDVSSEDLVFKKHAIGRVLCDEYGSCATSGHMVMFHGRTMRMRTYCDAVGCKEATMAVNSARYNRGLRIRSKTEGLEYTVFAARYDTLAEEMVIRMAVGLGL